MKVDGSRITLTNAREDYEPFLILIRDHGQPVTARGELSYELEGVTVVLTEPTDSLPIGIRLLVDPITAATDALNLLAGLEDPGERIAVQLDDVCTAMLTEGYTRRAVAIIADPKLDMIDAMGVHQQELIAFHFLWRSEQFRTHLYARSLNAVSRLPYVLFSAAQLHLTLSELLGAVKGPGPLTLHVGSLFMTASDIGVTDRIKRPGLNDPAPELPIGMNGAVTWSQVQEKALHILNSEHPNLDRLTPVEQRYLTMLNPPEPVPE